MQTFSIFKSKKGNIKKNLGSLDVVRYYNYFSKVGPSEDGENESMWKKALK